MPAFITLIVPDDLVDDVLAAVPTGTPHTTTSLPERRCAADDHKAWAQKYGVPAAHAVHEQWHASRTKKRTKRKADA